MRLFSLTSIAFRGEILFEFDDAGYLVKYDTTGAEITAQQQIWVLRTMPRHLAHLQRVLGDSKTAQLKEVVEDITFDKFWNRYNEKVRSSRKKSLARWNRMTRAEQRAAYYYIPRYEINIPNGVAKKYAETYLNAELWNNF